MIALIASLALTLSLQSGDSAAVAKAVSSFHEALAAGDSAVALALLSDDAMIVEAGEVESRADYHAHHLPADIEFARAVPSRREVKSVKVSGNVAWVVSTSTTAGTFRDRAIDSVGAELMVLQRTNGTWRITAIHWSSHARRR